VSAGGKQISATLASLGLFSATKPYLRSVGRAAALVGKGISGTTRFVTRPFSTPLVQRLAKADPVDVASGEVLLEQTDVELPGVLPLVLSRVHISSYRRGGRFGASWASTLDQRLEITGSMVYFVTADGMVLAYPLPTDGARVFPLEGPRLPLAQADSGFTVTDIAAGRVLRFAARPRHDQMVLPLVGIDDRNGNSIDIVHDEDGSITNIRHCGGYWINVETAGGRITAFRLRTLGAGDEVIVRYGYDTAGNLSEVFDPSGRPLRFTYDAEGRLTAWRDRNDCWYRYTYDADGRCVRAEGKGGFLTATFSHDPQARQSTMIDSLGNPTLHEFNERGRLIAEVDALGNRTTSEWDHRDRLLAHTDPLGRTVRYAYDADDNIISIERPDGRQIKVEYNLLNLPVRIVDADGAVWRQDYDDRGNLTTAVNPIGAVTRYGYDERGALRSVTDAAGNTIKVRTNAAGLPVEVIDATGATTRYRRDPFGRVIALIDRSGNRTLFGWTREGELAWRLGPGSAVERWRHDGEGNLVEHVNAAGHITRYEYTNFDLLAAQVGPDGARLEFSYDTELRLAEVTDPQGLVWRYEYDPVGNLVAETDFNGRRLTYVYDACGRLAARSSGNGETLRLVRDALGNVVEEWSDERKVATFDYDAAGRLTRARNGDADVRFERDALGQVTGESCNGRTVSSRFDPTGRQIWRRTPADIEAAWRYDPAGRPEAVTAAGQSIGFDYDASGRETARRIGERVLVGHEWGAAHQLVRQTVQVGGATVQQRDYGYHADGVLVTIDEAVGGHRRFTVDAIGRITGVEADGSTERYTYDAAGNVTAADWTRSPAATADDPRGPREHRGTLLRRAGALTYEYDRQGRLISRRSATSSRQWRYTWDVHDRLTGLVTPDGEHWRYKYDALGRRIAKQRLAPGGGGVLEQTDFTWDDDLMVEQSFWGGGREARVTTWEYLPGTTQPIMLIDGPGEERGDRRLQTIVTDPLGTPTDLVDHAGRLADARPATVWGQPARPGEPPTPLRYPGQYHDAESGLHYNHHRYYDPATGRYLTGDPLGLGGGPNPYTYVANPYHLTDPLGLMLCLPTRPDGELVLAGHGGYYPKRGEVTIPRGTSLAVYGEHGRSNYGALLHPHSPTIDLGYKRVPNMTTVAVTGSPTPLKVYTEGMKAPNYTLYPPGISGVGVYGKAKVIAFWPADLSRLLKPNMGRVHWAACQNVSHIPPWASPAARVIDTGAVAFGAYVGYEIYDVHHLHDEMNDLDRQLNQTDPLSPRYGELQQKYWDVERQYYDKTIFGQKVNQ
jgi:RHS repeat-associated protein